MNDSDDVGSLALPFPNAILHWIIHKVVSFLCLTLPFSSWMLDKYHCRGGGVRLIAVSGPAAGKGCVRAVAGRPRRYPHLLEQKLSHI